MASHASQIFGLARLLAPDESDLLLTASMEVLGSPPYMSPEQAAGDAEQVGRPSDVYSLGGVLYFLLTGRPPFQGASLTLLLAQVALDAPVAPRQLDPSLPLDLETVALKCLEKDPLRRYATAAALADELERFARGEPVHARPLGPLDRLWRWARRRPAWASTIAALISAVSLGIIGTTWQWRRAIAAYNDQLTARQAEAVSRRGLEENNYAADIRAAALAILEHQQPEIGRSLLQRQVNYPERGIEWRLLWNESRSRELARFRQDEEGAVTAVEFWESSQIGISGDSQGQVRFWDLVKKTAAHLPPLTLRGEITGLQFFPPNQLLVSSGAGEVTFWDLSALGGKEMPLPLQRWPGRQAALSANGQTLATSEGDFHSWMESPGAIRVWSPPSAPTPWIVPERAQYVALSPDGQFLALAGGPDGIDLWDIPKREKLSLSLRGSGRVWRPVFSDDGRSLAAGGRASAWWWSLPASLDRPDSPPTSLSGNFLPHPLDVWALRFLPNSAGGTLITACADRVLRGWALNPLARNQPHFVMPGSPEEIWALALSSDGRQIMTGVKSGTAHLWPGECESRRREVPNHSYVPPIFSPQSEWLMTIAEGAEPFALRSLTGEKDLSLGETIPMGFSRSPSLSIWSRQGYPAGLQARQIMTTGLGPFIEPSYPLGTQSIIHAGLSRDARAAFSMSDDQKVKVLRLRDGAELGRFSLQLPLITRVDLSAEGRYLAAGSVENQLQLVEVATGRSYHLHGHRHAVNAVAFSPDGTQLASVASDAELKIWETATGRELLWWPLREAGRHISFSPDGHWLAVGLITSGADETDAKTWLIETPEVK